MIFTSIVVAAVGGYLAFAGLIYFKQRDMVFPVWAVEPAPDDWHAGIDGLERLTLKTADGERLLAYWRAPDPGMPTVLTFHGNASSPGPHAERFAADAPWRTAGVGVLAPAYRGYPGSSGSPSEEGLILDGLSAYDFLKARLGEEHPILVHGHSLGSAVAVAVAAERPAAALYLESPFTSALALAKRQYPYLPGFLMRDPFPSDQRITEVRTGRVFIVHGTDDQVVGVEMAHALAERIEDPTLFIIEEGDHVSILGQHDGDVAEALGLIQ